MPDSAAAPTAEEKTVFEGRPAALDSVGRWLLAVLTVGLAAIVYWLKAVGTHVRLTDQRIILKLGVLSRKTEYVELYRVTDLQVDEPFFERVLGYGRVVVTSTDRGEARLVLRGLKDPSRLADQLRACVEDQKRQRRVATIAEA